MDSTKYEGERNPNADKRSWHKENSSSAQISHIIIPHMRHML